MKKTWIGAIALACLYGTTAGAHGFGAIHTIFVRGVFGNSHTGASHAGTAHKSTVTTYTYATICNSCGGASAQAQQVQPRKLPDTEQRCLASYAKAGNDVVLPDHRIMRIDALLDGAAAHCHNPDYPVYANLVIDTAPQEVRPSNAKIDVPDGWREKQLTDVQKAESVVLYAVDDQKHAGVTMSTHVKTGIDDMDAYVARQLTRFIKKLDDSSATLVAKSDINGMHAWRYEISGRLKNGQRVKYLVTNYEGEDELIYLAVWTGSEQFEAEHETFVAVADSLTGVKDEDMPKEASAEPLPQTGPAIEAN